MRWRRIICSLLMWFGLVPRLCAEFPLDVSYIDTSSQEWATFKGWVDTEIGGNPQYGFGGGHAALVYKVIGGTAYRDYAITKTQEQYNEAAADIAAGDRPPIASDSYLRIGRRVEEMVLTLAWCKDGMTAQQTSDWEAYLEQAVWNVWNHQDAEWGGVPHPWSGWSTTNPGNNYHYSFLQATMLWGLYLEDVKADDTWVVWLKNNKIEPLKDYYTAIPGGGSAEGTGYGTSQRHLFWDYRLWEDGTAEDLAANSIHASDSIDYWIHATTPDLSVFAPIGDQSRSSFPNLYDYHRHLMLEARLRATTVAQRNKATWWLNRISVQTMRNGGNYVHNLLPVGTDELAPTKLYHHASGVGHIFFRNSWNSDAVWVEVTAGSYTESHAHKDQGAFTYYHNGFLAVTENVYTHSGIRQAVEHHNIVRFTEDGDDIQQKFRATPPTVDVTPGPGQQMLIEADLSTLYESNDAVNSWQRDIAFGADSSLIIKDNFSIDPGVTATWQINTPIIPVVNGNKATAGDLKITVLQPASPNLSVVDWTAVDSSEYKAGYKLEVTGSSSAYEVKLEANGIVEPLELVCEASQ